MFSQIFVENLGMYVQGTSTNNVDYRIVDKGCCVKLLYILQELNYTKSFLYSKWQIMENQLCYGNTSILMVPFRSIYVEGYMLLNNNLLTYVEEILILINAF